MTPYRNVGGPDAGVYVGWYPFGAEVGEAVNCVERNAEWTRGGLSWGIVVAMPGSTKSERRREETAVADTLAEQGVTVVTHNLSTWLSWLQHNPSPELRAKRGAALRGKPPSREHIEKIQAAKRGKSYPKVAAAGIMRRGRRYPNISAALRQSPAARRAWDAQRGKSRPPESIAKSVATRLARHRQDTTC